VKRKHGDSGDVRLKGVQQQFKVQTMMHPHCMQEIVIRLRGPLQSSHNPVNGLRGQPSNYVHI